MIYKSIGFGLSVLAATLVLIIVYTQPPSQSGVMYLSSRWDPNGSDFDQYVWDNFTLASDQEITEIRWRGGFDPAKFGSGGSVIDFVISIYASIPGGYQPDVVHPALVEYHTGGNAGQTAAGTFGGIAMYDYQYSLPIPFQTIAGTKYWLQIEALQNGSPDWSITRGIGGDGLYFRRLYLGGDLFYQIGTGDAAFTLLRSSSNTHVIYLPSIIK